jgi:Domain of unknown function (DUF4911)
MDHNEIENATMRRFPIRQSDHPAPPQSRAMKTVTRYFRVDRREISFLRFILEAYSGMANMTTIDAAAGQIAVMIAPGCESEVTGLLDDLAGEILIEPSAEAACDPVA